MTQPAIKKWLDNFSASADLLSPPASRQHFDIWQFTTADQDAVHKWLDAFSASAEFASPPDSRQHFDI
jgi:hypothetical protein